MSTRTLHRRLADGGTSFRELLEQTRASLAEGYLHQTDMPITEISYLLGFSDVASFSRAFKRWTGSTPKHFRERGWS